MLSTWEFGLIRIVKRSTITRYDTYIRSDIMGDFSYYQLANGEIVAIDNITEDWEWWDNEQ